jgi:hypothetical protein
MPILSIKWAQKMYFFSFIILKDYSYIFKETTHTQEEISIHKEYLYTDFVS